VVIGSAQGAFRLRIVGDFLFDVPINRRSVSRGELRLQDLRSHFGGQGFTSAQASEVLGLSLASAKRLLLSMSKEGRVQKFGMSSATTYFFSDLLTRSKSA